MMTRLTQNDIKVDFDSNNDSIVTILKGDDAGIRFKYGRVAIDTDENGEPAMSFGYEVVSGTPVDRDAFVDSIAHLLHDMILHQIDSGELQYTGGIDEVNELNAAIAEAKAAVASNAASSMRESMPKVTNEATALIDNLGRAPGEFKAKPKESALAFLDRLATQGMSEMKH